MKPHFYKYFGNHILFGITIMATFALASCMFVPNEDVKQDKTKPVLCQGGVLHANEKVTIEACDPDIAACDPRTAAWDPTGAAGWHQIGDNGGYYAGTKLYTWGEHSAYFWSTPLTQVPGEPEPVKIPPQYWRDSQKCATVGESALVRSKGQISGYLMSFKAGGVYCMLQNPTTFLTDCKAPHSPAVYVGGQDFRDFGRECFELINEIRNKESKSPLERNELAECCADKDAKVNYEKGPHTSKCSGTQNEPATYSSIDKLLKEGIWDNMYVIEKQNYIKNPSTCYSAKWPGTCGHYVNMVIDPDVKSVACGLYETPSGSFHSVQNFYK